MRAFPIIAALAFLAGCATPNTLGFPLASGDTFDLLRHLQDDVKSENGYFRNRRDEAQKSVDHLNRIAGDAHEREIAESLNRYLAAIDEERIAVDKRQIVAEKMRELSIGYPQISNCKPPSPTHSPCEAWIGLKAQIPTLEKEISEEDEKATATKNKVPIK